MFFLATMQSAVSQEAPKETAPTRKPEEIAEKIVGNSRQIADQLQLRKTDQGTRDLQQQNIDLINELLKQAENQSSSCNNCQNNKPNSTGSSASGKANVPPKPQQSDQKNQSQSKENSTGRPNRDRNSRNQPPEIGPMPEEVGKGKDTKDDPSPQTGGTMGKQPAKKAPGKEASEGDLFGKGSPAWRQEQLSKLYEDIWGQLPERARQEMDAYYREQFMPKYSDALKRYYETLAKQRQQAPFPGSK
ncbi:MAG: hypothetical protein R3B84_08140 [Zavarzinella sp.]